MNSSPSSIQTHTGIFVDPFRPDESEFRIEDIGHALANQCRYSGHTRVHWSVAAHSCLVALLCEESFKLEGLMHDASEAYCIDLPRPIKRHPSMVGYRILEYNIDQEIRRTFGLLPAMPEEVHHADSISLWAEAEELLHGTSEWIDDRPGGHRDEIAAARIHIRDLMELDAKRSFLGLFHQLTGVDVHA